MALNLIISLIKKSPNLLFLNEKYLAHAQNGNISLEKNIRY